jgi:hypothetical protein
MKPLALGLAMLGLTAAPWAAAASTGPQLATSPAVDCLTPAEPQRGTPEFPFTPLKNREAGQVAIELEFTAASRAPEVRVLAQEGDAEFLKSVKAHVAKFRVPCMQEGDGPVRLRQTYVFTHKDDQREVFWTRPADRADDLRSQQLACMAATDGSTKPDYPDWARRGEVEGNILARLLFTAPDQAPQVTLYAATRALRDLAKTVEAWASKLRMPCLTGPPVGVTQGFRFRLEGNAAFGFRDLGFLQFLRMSKGLEKQNVRFDTNGMACPFDVELYYRQPYMRSAVGQIGGYAPERQVLLDWLATLTLDLNERQLAAVSGDSVRFTIPCIKIDLKPKETS